MGSSPPALKTIVPVVAASAELGVAVDGGDVGGSWVCTLVGTAAGVGGGSGVSPPEGNGVDAGPAVAVGASVGSGADVAVGAGVDVCAGVKVSVGSSANVASASVVSVAVANRMTITWVATALGVDRVPASQATKRRRSVPGVMLSKSESPAR